MARRAPLNVRIAALAASLVSLPAGAQLGIADAAAAARQGHPLIHAQAAAVRERLGEAQATGGAFAPRLTAELGLARERTPLTTLQRAQFSGIDQTVTDGSRYLLGIEQRLRAGPSLGGHVQVDRTQLSAEGSPNAVNQIPSFAPDNFASVGVAMTLPLLQGAGRTENTAAERSAAHELDAANRDLLHVTSRLMLIAARAYWGLVAAESRHAIAIGSAERSTHLMEQMQALIEAGKLPRATLSQLDANLAATQARAIEAAQDKLAARNELARAMGLRPDSLVAELVDELPGAGAIAPHAVHTIRAYQALALASRADLSAARERSEASKALRDAARLSRRQRLDLQASAGYTGLDGGAEFETYFSALGKNVGGANYAVGLQYAYALGNDTAEGRYLAQAAAYEARVIEERDLARNIEVDIETVVNALRASLATVTLAERAASGEAQALEAERERFAQGRATLFNLIQFQDRLDAAQNHAVNARLALANTIVELRHATGQLATTTEQPPARSVYLNPPTIPEASDG